MPRWPAWLLLLLSVNARAQAGADPVTPPRVLASPPAVLSAASAAGGRVVLRVLVTVDGSVGEVEVLESAGPDLDAAATTAVRKWRFAPATRAGSAVPSRVKIPFVFEAALAPQADAGSPPT